MDDPIKPQKKEKNKRLPSHAAWWREMWTRKMHCDKATKKTKNLSLKKLFKKHFKVENFKAMKPSSNTIVAKAGIETIKKTSKDKKAISVALAVSLSCFRKYSPHSLST